ncbi:twin-arginine translocation signal domain-containing protein [Brucella thiophenivorans]|uniref:Tat (Twin-arginine translocation) pathway signal sequence domain protein n=1 Tax=Brucella thiophenivorans TaxID=571255 RepID=A0A256FE50_9HYPH|nr:twin-arginine translocation signal domain-containing protein [Brucella thiophenivorans]OYR13058.1 tat (twin-arginine translocation) pathway signal sequence domain protein [Brucella thiophenivorans]
MINRRSFLSAAPCVGAALAFGSIAAVPVPDPMLELIQAYRAGKIAFNDIPDHLIPTVEDENRAIDETYGPYMEAILRNGENTPETTSIAGVREAIRLALEEDTIIDCMSENALRSALRYLETVDVQRTELSV